MSVLHAGAWPVVAIGLAGIAGLATVAAVRNRFPAALEWLRRAALVVVVAQASIGLALAVRGSGPSELLHWIYGAVVVGVLLAPGALEATTAPGRRSWALAAGSIIGVVLVWRLWASG